MRKKLAESLTARIFLLTTLILLGAGAITFGLIAWATPSTYTAVVNDNLSAHVNELIDKLAGTTLENSGQLLDDFIRVSGANAMLVGADGRPADTGARLTVVQAVYENGSMTVTTSEKDTFVSYGTTAVGAEASTTITMSEQAAIAAEVQFADREESYTLYVTPRLEAENLAVRALVQMAPWLLAALLAVSLLCALGRSLDEMAGKLSIALTELETANRALRGEVERERELDRQRMAFFSAASHELKTPVTILKGQLAGMLEGVGVYQDRDKYLLRSLQATGRMENLIREMLSISRMETGPITTGMEMVELSELVELQLTLDAGLREQREQRLVSALTPGITVAGAPSLLGKAVGNLLSNAALYSPDGAEIRVWCGMLEGSPALTVENTGAHISEEALPHLFEAFYREENSRNRATGGSGLGLYLVRMILDRHGAECTIENTQDGVCATVRFAD